MVLKSTETEIVRTLIVKLLYDFELSLIKKVFSNPDFCNLEFHFRKGK